MKSTSIKKVLILVTILAVPGFLYYLLQDQGKNRYKPLPILGPKQVASTFHSKRGVKIPDTIFHEVGGLNFSNQDGEKVSWDSLKGKIVIAYLFYTKADTYAASFTNKALQALNHAYASNQMIHFAGISVDPKHDQGSILKQYAIKLEAKTGKWDLLTGDSAAIFSFINKQLLVDAINSNQGEKKAIAHSNMILLLDTKHRIRGYYESTNQEALSKLDDEIKVLVAEELRGIKDGR